jgi:hypothetical protein
VAFRSFRQALLGGVMLVGIVAVAAPAFADVIVDFGLTTFGGNITYDPTGALGDSNTITGLGSIVSYAVNTVGTDDMTGVGLATAVNVNWSDPISFTTGTTETLAIPVTESFSGAGGTYSATFDSLFSQSTPGSTSLTWILEGILTLPDDATQDVFLSAAFTNVTGSNDGTTDVSFTETSTAPIPTPEPASIAVIGMGLLGLGAARLRKS